MKDKYGFHIIEYKKENIFYNLINIIFPIVLSVIISSIIINIAFSSLNIEIDFYYILKISIITSLICSVFYSNFFVALFGFLFGIGGISYYSFLNLDKIKIGILSILNSGYDTVRTSFGLPYADGFDKIIGVDCTNEVNFVIMILTVITAIVVSYLIGRNLSVIFSLFIVIGVIFYRSILNCNDNSVYVVVLIGCFFAVLFIKYSFVKKIKSLKGLICGILAAVLGFVIVFSFSGALFTKNSFNNLIKPMAENDYLKYAIKDSLILKYAEYKDFNVPYEVDPGQLGFYSVAKPKFKSVFQIKLYPIGEDSIYIKSYTGTDYKYRSNTWISNSSLNDISLSDLKAKKLEEKEADYNEIEFITYREKGFKDEVYVPYYTVMEDCDAFNYINDCEVKGTGTNKYKVKAYEDEMVEIDDEKYYEYVKNSFLNIDNENLQTAKDIISKASIDIDNDDIEEIENKLYTYFENNYTYEFDRNVVPFGEDYVNYFLEETKKGNFSHFSSATVLIYRALGIPARFASGYKIDSEQILGGKFEKKGISRTDVNRANFYSWAEVYKKGIGWIVVDSSPSPSFLELSEKYDKEEEVETRENILSEYFKPIENEIYNPLNLGKNLLNIFIIIFVIFILALIIKFFGKKVFSVIKWKTKYKKADNSKKVYMIMDNLRKELCLNLGSDFTEITDKLISLGLNENDAKILKNLSNKAVYGKSVESKDIYIIKNIVKQAKKLLK
ncbi:MAG: transglutaminase domain-containing protein [Lachnospirales bacterium]